MVRLSSSTRHAGSGANATTTLYVEGLSDLARALRSVDKGLAREVNAAFKEGGRLVQQKAQELVRSQGLVASGDALRGIKVKSSNFAVSVTETARRDDKAHGARYFPYPRLRRFWPLVMQPAREATHDEVEKATRQAIEDLTWI